MENWLVLQNFYNGLIAMSRGHIDVEILNVKHVEIRDHNDIMMTYGCVL
jgi:uncharacterized protein YehS (DUF1456 family)